MRHSHPLLTLVLATSVLSWGMSASAQNPPRPAPKPAATKAATAKPRPAAVKPAQTTDPFVGVWTLNAGKSKYESGAAPRSFTRTYEDRGGGTIVMITDASNGQGTAARAYVVYKRDGKSYPEAAVGATSIRMVTITAIDRRTENAVFTVDGSTSEIRSTITISADGMTMTQALSGKNAKGQFTNTLVFDKQP